MVRSSRQDGQRSEKIGMKAKAIAKLFLLIANLRRNRIQQGIWMA